MTAAVSRPAPSTAPIGAVLLLAVLGAALFVAVAVILVALPNAQAEEQIDGAFMLFLFAGLWLYWALRAIIVLRANGHLTGWLFALAAPLMASVFACDALWFLFASQVPPNPLGDWFLLLGALLFTPAIILTLPAVAITFPTGTLPGPRWRASVALVVVMVGIRSVAILVRPGPTGDGGPPNPLTPWLPAMSADTVRLLATIDAVGTLSVAIGAGLGVAAIIVRFRRSAGVERQQLKWFLAAMAPAAVLLPLSLSPVGQEFSIVGILSVATLPIAAVTVAIAILRYRLYEIDRIISRTIGWAVATGILVAVFAGAVVALEAALAGFTAGETLAVAASTLVAFALFQPVRRRVQRAVDRRFDRARCDAHGTADDFARRLRAQTDLHAVLTDLSDTTGSAVAPMALGVWIRPPRVAR